MTLDEILEVFSNHLHGITPTEYRYIVIDKVIWDDYLPRAVGGITIGAILGVGGAVMQTVVKNPMTDAYTTGISSGALFGMTLFVITGCSLVGVGGNIGMIVNAFVFSLIPCMVIIAISVFRQVTSTMMILIGVGLMYVFSACTTLLKFTANPDDIETIFEWNVGTLANLGAVSMPFVIVACIVLFISMMYLSNSLNVMSSNDRLTQSLGVDPLKIKVIVFVLVSVCTAVAVCFSGSIGFVGLVIPHIARRIVGSNCRLLIPYSAVLGALLLTGSDFLAKQLYLGGLPVGVITALVGSPVFLYLLTKKLRTV